MALKIKYKKDVRVDILADLIEVRDKKWQNAVEAYLHTQKFYLIAEPKYFIDALRIYDGQKFKKRILRYRPCGYGKIRKT
jgi:hypothetical protein